MAKTTSTKEAGGKGVQARKTSIKGVASKEELDTRKNAVKVYGADKIFEHKPSYATNSNSNSTKNTYYELKNKAVSTWNKGVDQQNKGASKVSVGLTVKGSLNKAKSKAQDAYAEAYKKSMSNKTSSSSSTKKKSSKTKASSSTLKRDLADDGTPLGRM